MTAHGERVFTVRVKPRAVRDEVLGERDGVLEVRVAAPPAKGAANARLLKLLASHFGVPASSLRLISGHGARTKRVALRGPAA